MNQKTKVLIGSAILSAVIALAGCGDSSSSTGAGIRSAANANSCWGQASAVFAQMGNMGQHASQQANPRLGLRNLARALADDGIIPDDSMASLGAFVADELNLSIDACM